MRRKLPFLLSIGFSLLVLFGCAKKEFVIGILVYDENDTYIDELTDILIEQLPKDLQYKIEYASGSQFNQNQQLLSLLEEGVDLLIINLVDRLAASSIVEKCASVRVPVIFFNREPIENAMKNYEDVYYVGADPDQQGEEQAYIIKKIFGPTYKLNSPFDKNVDGIIQMVILKGEQGHQDAERRTSKLLETLINLNYQIEVLETSVANWQRQLAKDMVAQIDRNFGEQIELIVSNNDDMALGAIDYYLEKGIFIERNGDPYNQPILIVGVDGTQKGSEAIDKGLMAGTVKNDAEEQSEAIVELIQYVMSNGDRSKLSLPLVNGKYYYVPGYQIIHPSLESE